MEILDIDKQHSYYLIQEFLGEEWKFKFSENGYYYFILKQNDFNYEEIRTNEFYFVYKFVKNNYEQVIVKVSRTHFSFRDFVEQIKKLGDK